LSPTSLAGVIGLGERGHDAVSVAVELGDDANPALRAASAEVAFATCSEIGFAVDLGS
jgi:hypothetical protein